ncbi:MAG TPA: sulfotransferase [Acetobacteraceae bacterium]|nr:sulfotransferase [Acetobacteraceae bacterium]
MAQQLVADALIDEAIRKTGLSRFDSDSFREGLEILLADFNSHTYPDSGIARMKSSVVEAIANRLKTTAYLDAHPALLERPIERPVFVFGVPRTGTTLVSNLLAADPARRSPLTWEIDDPVPPATSATLRTDPRALARLEAERKMLAARPDMGKYYRGSAIYPNEDVFIMGSDFKTLMLESRGKLPAYREWIFSTDVTSAYQYHKRFLQLLQSEAPGIWNLKMPSHALYLDTLLKVYPDARLIWTHRDPFTAVGSFCSLISLGHMGFLGSVDKAWIAENCPWQAGQHVERALNSRDRLGEDRIVDVHYGPLMRDPIGTMRVIYKALGDEFTEAAEAGMRAWLIDNPQDKFGRHEYKLEQYGLSVAGLTPLFERYLARFDVEREN